MMENEQLYLNLDTNRILTEKDIRLLSFDLELENIYDNIDDYKKGLLDLIGQLDFVRYAIVGDIDKIINDLESSWQINIIKCPEKSEY